MPIDKSADFHRLRAQILAARDAGERGTEQDLVDIARSHQNGEIRRSAIVTLRAFHSELLWPIIHEILAHSENENLIETAIKCVGELGSEATESLLTTIFSSAQRARFGVQAARNAQARLARKAGKGVTSRLRISSELVQPRKQLFLCYSNADWESVVEPLVTAFRAAGITCWYDRAEILPGDSIVEKVNDGLVVAEYALAILSPSFLDKHWPQRELSAIINFEASSGVVKLIVLLVGDAQHRTRVFNRFPLLNDKLYIAWDGNPNRVVDAIRRRIEVDAALPKKRLQPTALDES